MTPTRTNEDAFINTFLAQQDKIFSEHHLDSDEVFDGLVYERLVEAVKQGWTKAVDHILGMAKNRGLNTFCEIWDCCIRDVNEVDMADVFLAHGMYDNEYYDDARWLNALARYPNQDVFERCFVYMMAHHPQNVNMELVMIGVVMEGNLDKMRMIEGHLTDDLKTQAIVISCAFNNAFIVDFWYTTHLGRAAREYILSDYEDLRSSYNHIDQGYIDQGMAYLNSLIEADELREALNNDINANDRLERKASKI